MVIKINIWCVCGAAIVSVGFLLISEVILMSRLGVDAWRGWKMEKKKMSILHLQTGFVDERSGTEFC